MRVSPYTVEVIHGTHEDTYKAMPKYCTDIEQTNPNSVVHLDVTSENQFRCVFISYGACAIGFANCRPLLGLDGNVQRHPPFCYCDRCKGSIVSCCICCCGY